MSKDCLVRVSNKCTYHSFCIKANSFEWLRSDSEGI